jgi:polar amino acid transport system substrate-binding protein
MKIILTIILHFAIGSFWLATGISATPVYHNNESKKITVAVYDSPPFGMIGQDGEITGLSVECWKDIAGKLQISYDFVLTDMDELLSGVQEKRYQIGIGAITATPARELLVDFTHPVNPSGTGIAVSTRSDRHPFWSLWHLIFINLLELISGLLVLLVIFGILIWLVERRNNARHFHRRIKGVGDGIWWAAVTMTTVGYGDKSPKSMAGRILAVLWMFTSVILVSLFTASTTTTLTSSKIESTIQSKGDLRTVKVGAARYSSGEEYLLRNNIYYQPYETIEEAIDEMIKGNIDAVVSNVPVLKYLKQKEYKRNIRIIPKLLADNYMAMAIHFDNPLRESINRELLKKTASEEWKQTLSKYLGDDLW